MPQHVVIIGAVALGPKTAARYKRLDPEGVVTLVDRDSIISYGACGIPYFVSGEVSDETELRSTAFHMVRDPEFFRTVKDVDVLAGTEALSIDRKARTVLVRRLADGTEKTLPYDRLVLATGSTANALRVPGADLAGIHHVNCMEAAIAIRKSVAGGHVGKAVVVGGGFIGLEMAVAFTDLWGIDTTVVEFRDQILPGVYGPNLARMAQKHMEDKGVHFRLGEGVRAFEGEGGAVRRVVTDKATLDADLVIVSVGVTPNSKLAKDAGLDVGPRGAVRVDEFLRTSDPNIYAGGDCIEVKNRITGKPFFLPLGSLANRQGRIIGTNLADPKGCAARFEGVVGSWCVKLFDRAAAGTGLSFPAAKAAGFDALSVHVSMVDRAHFHPDKKLISMDLVVERGSGRVLGMQALGISGDAVVGKVDVVAALLPFKPTAADLGSVELAYSPPFSAALDVLNVLGNAADNMLAGRNKGIQVDEFAKLWAGRREKGAPLFLDCRELGNAEPYLKKYPDSWRNIPQGELRKHLAEVPRDRPVVLVCNTGARSYESFVTLAHAGFTNIVSVEGGMSAVLAAGIDLDATK